MRLALLLLFASVFVTGEARAQAPAPEAETETETASETETEAEAEAETGTETVTASESAAGTKDTAPAPASEALADNDACAPAMQRAEDLLGAGHKVDAHLIAQTMSFLCASAKTRWDILDAVALSHLEEHERAFSLLESIALQAGPQAERARVLAAWVLIKGDLGDPQNLRTFSVPDAARLKVFARIHRGRSPGAGARDLSVEMRRALAASYARLEAVDTKRPWLAGTLSTLVPGLGQAYAGSWQGAALSLLLNGIFVAATVELAQHELYFASATTGLAGSIFYVGNILNAVDLARRYNEGATKGRRKEIETLLVPEAYYGR